MSALLQQPLHPDFLSQLSQGSPVPFATPCAATPLESPSLGALNHALLHEWGMGAQAQADTHTDTSLNTTAEHTAAMASALANTLSGNQAWPTFGTGDADADGDASTSTSTSTASVYSGHQFGVWAGQLGDGRALMLGELHTSAGPVELQLKGAGPTPYSRRGDGRAVLRSSIREYLCSEAMHGLGVPTTRALALVASPTRVRRETIETTAVVARAAHSFLRFGHLEHFAHHGEHQALKVLVDATIARYFPSLLGLSGDAQMAGLLSEVSQRTARLMAQWQSVGFCHGVMNTDNMSLLGLTLDYGPFQFLDGYDPAHICNHSDDAGRYAFNQQPQIGYWNLHALAQALVPLMSDSQAATTHLQAALQTYPDLFAKHYTQLMRAKLGLDDEPDSAAQREADAALINDWMSLLASQRVDHTLAWRRLAHEASAHAAQLDETPPPVLAHLFTDTAPLHLWWHRYAARLHTLPAHSQATWGARMHSTNPKYVLRNHLAQLAITAAHNGDWTVLNDLKTVLDQPFAEHPRHQAWAELPPAWAGDLALSCSS
jgi:serine/tyrosine/threonine adenylyltransferase